MLSSRLVATLLLLFSSTNARAIDPSELILTAQGGYARALGPDRYLRDTQGGAIYGQIEKALNERWSVGLGLSQVAFRDGSSTNYNFSSIDAVSRRWFKPWKGFNPYLQLGLGGNLFKDAFKNPWGDIFHAQLGLGSHYVLDTHWALDYGLSYHMVAPLDTPHQYIAARFGLSYRYGTQPKVNRIAPPPVAASGVELLDEAKVREVVGKVEYTVKPGDTLYSIAGKPNTLGRPILWPLVADENAGTIRDPHLIQPDQVIVVRRNYSPEEAEKARKKATETLYQRPGFTQAQR